MTLSHNRFDFTLQVPPDRDLGTVHFVAIGGAGMSGVARVMLERGVAVQGSDAKPSAVLDDLASRGAVVHVGHDAAYLGQADTVVVSTAIRETNPELAGARSLGLRVLHRAQGLAATMADARVRVAVAGANGKTTTTAMLASVLMATGADPSLPSAGNSWSLLLTPERVQGRSMSSKRMKVTGPSSSTTRTWPSSRVFSPTTSTFMAPLPRSKRHTAPLWRRSRPAGCSLRAPTTRGPQRLRGGRAAGPNSSFES